MGGAQYLLGDYDQARDKLIVTEHGRFNFGASFPGGVHAPSAVPDGQGGLIAIFYVADGKPTQGWNQLMTLPRRLTLRSRSEVGIAPAGGIESLRGNPVHIDITTFPENQDVFPDAIRGNSMEIVVEFDPIDAPMVEMKVLCSPNREEYTRITFFKERGYGSTIPGKPGANSLISLDTSRSSELSDVRSRPPETAPVFIEPDETLRLRVFIDRSIVEVFVNEKQCVAARVYPGRADSLGVSLRSQGRDVKLKSLNAWQMKSIYDL